MALEIERKYLVKGYAYRRMAEDKDRIVQGYLSRDPERTVRIRISQGLGYITIKGKTSDGVREEFEYPIPKADADAMLRLCSGRVIEKTRYYVTYEGRTWEIDEFHGDLEPLVVAEIELGSPEERFDIPPFISQEVTGDPAYYNSNL